jgi:predicted Rossmann fold nucleotide-binding protein DprA/Smf involved in DNA uptake
MKLYQTIAIVGSRDFKNYEQIKREVLARIENQDTEFVSGGATGADSMAQRLARENGFNIKIYYPKYAHFGKGATFTRNKLIVEDSDIVLAFYQKGRFQLGGTANSAEWARKLNIPLEEFEEE